MAVNQVALDRLQFLSCWSFFIDTLPTGFDKEWPCYEPLQLLS